MSVDLDSNHLLILCHTACQKKIFYLILTSAGLGISPMNAMHLAERLYTQGFISYPRTETTQYAANFDFNEALSLQTKNPVWGDYAKKLLGGNLQNPRKGQDAGDHPPITPTAEASQAELSGDSWRLYDFITRHFLATVNFLPCLRFFFETKTKRDSKLNFLLFVSLGK